MLRQTPRPQLFPYTTLFRSRLQKKYKELIMDYSCFSNMIFERRDPGILWVTLSKPENARIAAFENNVRRSEEDTSELQSAYDLVCVLLRVQKHYARETALLL